MGRVSYKQEVLKSCNTLASPVMYLNVSLSWFKTFSILVLLLLMLLQSWTREIIHLYTENLKKISSRSLISVTIVPAENRNFHQVPVPCSLMPENKKYRKYTQLSEYINSLFVALAQVKLSAIKQRLFFRENNRNLIRDVGTRGNSSFSARSHALIYNTRKWNI